MVVSEDVSLWKTVLMAVNAKRESPWRGMGDPLLRKGDMHYGWMVRRAGFEPRDPLIKCQVLYVLSYRRELP